MDYNSLRRQIHNREQINQFKFLEFYFNETNICVSNTLYNA